MSSLVRILRSCVRVTSRSFALLAIVVSATTELAWSRLRHGEALPVDWRAAWLNRWSRRILRVLHVKLALFGRPPARGIVVSNHLGYLDILVLASLEPMVFVSKAEVRSWPVLGWLAACAGTLFLRRERLSDVIAAAHSIESMVTSGIVTTLFLEGTSSDGRKILPFHSSLLQPAAKHGLPVAPAWIGYRLSDGIAETEVCYWGDMTFGWHLLNLLSKRSISGTIAFAPAEPAVADRKILACTLQNQVCLLRQAVTDDRPAISRTGP